MNRRRAWAAVRLLLATIAMLVLSGCAVPEEEEMDPLLGTCPQWELGPWSQTSMSAAATVFTPEENGTVLLAWKGLPVDRYFLTIEAVEGKMQLRAFANSTDVQRGIQDFRDAGRPDSLPVLTVDASAVGATFEVLLTAAAHGTEPAPDALRLEWSGDGSVEYTVQAAYRVCGAVL